MPATWFKLAICVCLLGACGRSAPQSAHEHDLALPTAWTSAHQAGTVDTAWLLTFQDPELLRFS